MGRNKNHLLRNLLAASVVGAGVFEGVLYKFFQDTFLRKDPDPSEETDQATPECYRRFHAQKRAALADLEKLPMEMLEIHSQEGFCLRGRLYRVKEYNKKVVIAFHGFHASGINDMARFVNMYTHLGCDFLIISQRAHELSDGKYITFGVNEQTDGIRWCRKIQEIYGEDVQILIHGLSMGAATVLMMAGNSALPQNVKACIADSPYDDFYLEADHVYGEKIFSEQLRKVMLKNMNLFTQTLAGFRLQDAAPINAVKNAKIPVLFIHGTADDFVPCEMGQRLYDVCPGEKEQFLVEGAAHVCSFTEAPEAYEEHFLAFCRKYL